MALEGEVGLGLLEGVRLRSKMECSGGEMGDVVGCSEQVGVREASVLFLMLHRKRLEYPLSCRGSERVY